MNENDSNSNKTTIKVKLSDDCKMPVQLYHHKLSAPAREARIVAKHIGLSYEEKEIDLLSGAHKKPEFLTINPFHCVPTLVDDGFALWKSRSTCKCICLADLLKS